MTKQNCSKLIWTSLMAFCAYSQNSGYVSAKKLFYADAGGPVTPKVKPSPGILRVPTSYPTAGLRYAVIQEVSTGKEVAVNPAKEFHSGDRIRFEFESNLDGYLYVTEEGSSGSWKVLFPDARINGGTNHVQKRQPYSVPARPKYFVFNDVPGNETLTVVLAKSLVNGLPAEAKPTTQTVDQSVINELNSNFKSKELVFEFETDTGQPPVATVPTASTYVVNKNENGQAVVATISLKHGRLASADEPSAAALYKTRGSFGLRITVELKRDGAIRMVSPQSDFRNGDQIRLHFVSNVDGYVYALNETPSGDTKVLFPTPEAGSNNMVRKAEDYKIPTTNGWFTMRGNSGAEKVLMILSPRALPEMEDKLHALDRPSQSASPASPPVAKPAATNPQAGSSPSVVASGGADNSTAPVATNAGATVNPAASGGAAESTAPASGKKKKQNPMSTVSGDLRTVTSAISLVGGVASIPRDVTSIPGLGSKDLVFEDDLNAGAAYVSSKAEGLTGPVIFSIALVYH